MIITCRRMDNQVLPSTFLSKSNQVMHEDHKVYKSLQFRHTQRVWKCMKKYISQVIRVYLRNETFFGDFSILCCMLWKGDVTIRNDLLFGITLRPKKGYALSSKKQSTKKQGLYCVANSSVASSFKAKAKMPKKIKALKKVTTLFNPI